MHTFQRVSSVCWDFIDQSVLGWSSSHGVSTSSLVAKAFLCFTYIRASCLYPFYPLYIHGSQAFPRPLSTGHCRSKNHPSDPQPFLIFFLPSSALINRVGDNDNCTSIFSFLISDPPLNGTQLEHQHLVPKSTSECK